jgi:2,3-bisphosphoglycerate-independent phosphoglycerate mutase
VAAAALGLQPDPARLRFLGHFVQINEAGQHIPVHPSSLEEQSQLLEDLQTSLRSDIEPDVVLRTLSLGRFVLDLPAGNTLANRTIVAYDHEGVQARLPGRIRTMIQRTETLLATHPVNGVRMDLGDPVLQSIWCWSGGRTLPVRQDPRCSQALMSPDPLVRGLAAAWDLEVLPTGDPFRPVDPGPCFDVSAFQRLLKNHDEVVVWIPAPFASIGYEGVEEKVRRLDAVDYYVTGPILEHLRERGDSRLLLLAAGLRHRGRPEKGPGPFILWGQGIPADRVQAWSESASAEGALGSPKFPVLLTTLRKN